MTGSGWIAAMAAAVSSDQAPEKNGLDRALGLGRSRGCVLALGLASAEARG